MAGCFASRREVPGRELPEAVGRCAFPGIIGRIPPAAPKRSGCANLADCCRFATPVRWDILYDLRKGEVLPSTLPVGTALEAAETKPGVETKGATKVAKSEENDEVAAEPEAAAKPAGAAAAAAKPASKYPPFADVAKDFTPVEGLFHLYRKDSRLLAEIEPSHFGRDFIVLIAIARGIGEGSLLGGMPVGFGDDWLWQFRKVDDNIHIVRRNIRFRAAKGSPEEKAVRFAYTDSVLYSLPIITMGPHGGAIVDFTQIFISDLPQIGAEQPGFSFSPSKSTWAAVKGFKDNIELEVAAAYNLAPNVQLDGVADSRSATINVHYSISALPETGYQPRMADDRIGYFLTVLKDYSKKGVDDNFVRYINRWDLQKADPAAELSPPKKPVVFWIEKTVPFQYRKPIADGILEWNKAFEKAGIVNAVEVRQQPDNADWDPEDINYNTFRWITAGAGFAMGPSRVNPLTGQILDADIIFDADFIRFWKTELETFTPASVAALTNGPIEIDSYRAMLAGLPSSHRHSLNCRCELHTGMTRELAFGAAVLAAAGDADPKAAKDPKADAEKAAKELDKMIMQGLKEVAMHEVGHTLGLRHNFKASTLFKVEELNDVEKTKEVGLTASVMDYNPTNIARKGTKQGDYYSTTIGPYDMWAIEYGYKPFASGEGEELKKIASRSAEPALAFATDEDTRGIDSDPLVNRFDFGKEPLDYAKARSDLIESLWPGLVDRVTKTGDGYQRARQAFGVLLGNYGSSLFFASRYVGGIYTNRDHKGDPNARPPFVVVPAEKQRAALKLLSERMLSDKPFAFPPDQYNYLASTRWNHWGVRSPERTDYAVHDVILMWQQRVLDQLLSSLTLKRLHDAELKIPSDQDALTVPELLDVLTTSIYSELDDLKAGDYTNRKPAVSSLRRNLQRAYLKRLGGLALGPQGSSSGIAAMLGIASSSSSNVPEDVQTLAYAELQELDGKIGKVLAGPVKLDAYSKAHLTESQQRIKKILGAQLTTARP
ncbi:MAG: zinc-dependent metalloprotease [Planctomycetia bacterium]|nr:zinc-dependent metalloprotease [Planctomycetia bacterium]